MKGKFRKLREGSKKLYSLKSQGRGLKLTHENLSLGTRLTKVKCLVDTYHSVSLQITPFYDFSGKTRGLSVETLLKNYKSPPCRKFKF